jgi:2-polyprenyl-3-methyl-5-hydroxy-6-metoxy-1,4-benzoquinol methylase
MLLRSRSTEKEYLDAPNIPTLDLFKNLEELDVINRYLGGYGASLRGLADLLNTKTPIKTIVDIGFGGGDSIKQLAGFASQKKMSLFFFGVDLKMDCIRYAEKNLSAVHNKELICDDYRNISLELLQKIDVVHCSLFLHHLTDEEIVELFKFCKTNNCTILINDLHRHWLAYLSIKIITSLFSKSYLVKNDAPLSVKRGFKKHELQSLLKKAGFIHFSITWTWAFRYRLIAFE